MRWLLLTLTFATTLFASPTLTVRTRTERPPEMDAITIAELAFDGGVYALVLPRKWQFQPDPASRTLRFQSETDRAQIIVHFSGEAPQAALQSADGIRQFVAPNLSSARVLEEFPIPSGTGEGKGAVFAYGLDKRCRAAVIPIPRGCVTFALTCKTNELASEQIFGGLVTSFRMLTPPPAK